MHLSSMLPCCFALFCSLLLCSPLLPCSPLLLALVLCSALLPLVHCSAALLCSVPSAVLRSRLLLCCSALLGPAALLCSLVHCAALVCSKCHMGLRALREPCPAKLLATKGATRPLLRPVLCSTMPNSPLLLIHAMFCRSDATSAMLCCSALLGARLRSLLRLPED